KIFEYIKAGTPLVASNLVERALIIQQYQIGLIVDNLEGKSIATAINRLIFDQEFYHQCKENCKKAAEELTWENEEKVLEKIYLNQ
ncbi:MAG: glycosyltransferase, partial [Bacteroidales bacterium]